ncbi:hypothetical protein SGPA1_50241 [Streptomyces misionensis JCM 4497]
MATQHQEGREGRRRGRPGRLPGPRRVAAAVRDHGRARPLPAPPAVVLPAHVDGPQHRGPQPDAAVLRPAQRREPLRGDDADRRRPRLVLLRRLRQHRPRGAAVERHAVADAARRLRARCHRLRPARHLRLPGRVRPPVRPDPVQGRHGRSGRGVPRRMGLPAEQAAPQGARHLHVAPLSRRRLIP